MQFSVGGRRHEIDLSTANTQELRETLRPHIIAGRRAQPKSPRAPEARSSTGGNPETAKIPAWVKENGYKFSNRGWVRQSIKDVYYAAQ